MRSATTTSASATCTALLAWMKAAVGFVGIPEHAEQSAEHAALAGIPTPLQSLAALATYFMTFGGDSERAIGQIRCRRGRPCDR